MLHDMTPSKTTIRLLWLLFLLTLAATLAAEFFIHVHAYFGIDGWRFFNAGFGFLSCAGIIIFSKLVGVFLKRPTAYYEEKYHGK